MAEKKAFYITTTIPYVNAPPHIGFALEIVQADILARYHALLGEEVFFNFGSDEHGVKIYRKALEEGKTPQAYVDEYAAKFDALKGTLNLSYNAFTRTTDPHHKAAAQEFWKRCHVAGDIYKKNYQIKYCVGCELEKTDSELVDGKCPLHPNLELELIDEENYFFKLSKYKQPLLDLYTTHPELVVPDFRFNEIKKFIESGPEYFSISRLKEKMPWGVPVPGDDTQVMYVWFDALVNYISTLGWPEDEKNFEKFWGTKDKPNGLQLAGKDQIRQQAAMWQ
ncbi:MAG TPA: methionine--tRNA ligase, partial [Candidatus Paceibacterota bacterium]|nr:methionine--tRNA ligase [Candidatus Paceibacterota bacterium]